MLSVLNVLGQGVSNMVYNIYGSEDGIDSDIAIFLETLPSIEECKILCKDYEKISINEKKTNVNLVCLHDGVLINSFKGSFDEVNNSIFYTYNLHKQEYPIQIEKALKRNIELKVARFLRETCSILSRTKYRDMMKAALKNDSLYKLKELQKVILSDIDNFNKNNLTNADCLKGLAFQIIQIDDLLHGKEIYTKREAKELYPKLTKYLYRECDKATKELDVHFHFLLNILLNTFDLASLKE